jgi:hypothetical protein
MILMRLMECEVEAGDGGGDEKRREERSIMTRYLYL